MSDDQERVELSELPEEERKEVMQAARAFVRTKSIARKQEQSAKRKRQSRAERIHRAGSHWYELDAYFDPHEIEATPIKDSGFMLGVLEDFVVIEVKKGTSDDQIQHTGKLLGEMGIKVLIVREGIQFMRLKACGHEQEKKLNKILEEQEAKRGADSGS
jgi:hypothetical protein